LVAVREWQKVFLARSFLQSWTTLSGRFQRLFQSQEYQPLQQLLRGIFLSLTGAYQERTRLRDPAPGRMTARGRRETSRPGPVLSRLLRSPGSRLPPSSSEAHTPPRGSLTPPWLSRPGRPGTPPPSCPPTSTAARTRTPAAAERAKPRGGGTLKPL